MTRMRARDACGCDRARRCSRRRAAIYAADLRSAALASARAAVCTALQPVLPPLLLLHAGLGPRRHCARHNTPSRSTRPAWGIHGAARLGAVAPHFVTAFTAAAAQTPLSGVACAADAGGALRPPPLFGLKPADLGVVAM